MVLKAVRSLLGRGVALWPHVRAAFVAFHVVAILVAASPDPALGLRRSAWKDPTVVREYERWGAILHVEPARLQAFMWEAATRAARLRRRLLAPFAPYLDLARAQQGWQMFVAPHRFPTRLQIQARARGAPPGDAGFQTVFEERRPDARWRAERFETERMRSAVFRWGWSDFASYHASACRTFAAELFAERGDLEEVRCRFHKAESPSPAALRAGRAEPGRWIDPVLLRRDEVTP